MYVNHHRERRLKKQCLAKGQSSRGLNRDVRIRSPVRYPFHKAGTTLALILMVKLLQLVLLSSAIFCLAV